MEKRKEEGTEKSFGSLDGGTLKARSYKWRREGGSAVNGGEGNEEKVLEGREEDDEDW